MPNGLYLNIKSRFKTIFYEIFKQEMHAIKPLTQKISIIFAIHIILLCYGAAAAATKSPLIQDLRTTITTLAKARNTLVLKHFQPGKENEQRTAEQQDVLVFVSYLDGRIYYYCEQLLTFGGAGSLDETGCPTNQDGSLETTRFSTIPTESSQTIEEKLTELDSSFSDSLGSFDEMLLDEQQKVASHTPKQREEGQANGIGPYEGTESNGSGERKGENARTKTYSDTSGLPAKTSSSRSYPIPAGTGSNRGAGVGNTKQSQIPPTSGNKDMSQTDDDIIAKQLKEAAEQETDPQVKAQLWEEYRKYREGTK